jgi:hypothetical protein
MQRWAMWLLVSLLIGVDSATLGRTPSYFLGQKSGEDQFALSEDDHRRTFSSLYDLWVQAHNEADMMLTASPGKVEEQVEKQTKDRLVEEQVEKQTKEKVLGCPLLLWLFIYLNSSFSVLGVFMLCLCCIARDGKCMMCCSFCSAVLCNNLIFAVVGYFLGWTISDFQSRWHHWCIFPLVLPWLGAAVVFIAVLALAIIHANRVHADPDEARLLAASLFEQSLVQEKYVDSMMFKRRCDRFFDVADPKHKGKASIVEIKAVLRSICPHQLQMQLLLDPSGIQTLFGKEDNSLISREEFYEAVRSLESRASELGYGQGAGALECPVCFIPYNLVSRMPQTLKCDHTFCDACIAQLFQGDRLPCPICREMSSVADVQISVATCDQMAESIVMQAQQET